ncbi:hypothetical protein O6H91_16G063500 [Diphasiastrum complanatum]|uniref:Uncharacterized protein n=1 Tax=Diphasiastrum complanatum TaxID=34168 RepID=A0ACC2BCV9_DIPCM|nr:hypothetical protein O6H91_16G063500 [Diphasiastrum complanatum]
MNGAFASQILSEKLSKLNNSQQSIETLSHWCIFHRKNAKQVVETWGREFFSSPREQRVPFLFLANDILQNSRRKGGEFVNEFWKVLPTALREVLGTGEESVRTTVLRLIEIWEERKVFGSRVQSLREELLGYDTFSAYENNDKLARVSSKMRKDGSLEKVATAYQAVQENSEEEELTFEKCNAAVNRIGSIEKETHLHNGLVNDPSTFEELQQLQVVLSQCIEQFEASEMSRLSLVSRLKEVLHDQEIRLDQIRTQLQQHLLIGSPKTGEVSSSPEDEFRSNSRHDSNVNHHEYHPILENDGSRNVMLGDSLTATEPLVDNLGLLEDDNKNHQTPAAAAAEVAAKLAASPSSAQMLTSILSSLAAEGIHASYHNGADSQSSPLDLSPIPQEKRQRLDGTTDISPHMDMNASYIPHQLSPRHQQSTSTQQPPAMLHRITSVQPHSSSVQHQPPPPPLPPFMGTTVLGNPYEYSIGIPPLRQGRPVLGLPHMSMMAHQPLPPGCNPASYPPLQSSGMGFYNQPPLPPPPAPLPRQ